MVAPWGMGLDIIGRVQMGRYGMGWDRVGRDGVEWGGGRCDGLGRGGVEFGWVGVGWGGRVSVGWCKDVCGDPHLTSDGTQAS